ncbi:MarR family winged helix-turn-helix transcriptional regulator [Kocuria atrinae]|uniref:MarR family winged helix-turn-helix transcriptional regulator n=1 Tax=Kocuria atrinae TaxID=592377 RepID=UPI00030B5593|nr:MarR family transcriptional regulator [Kocuria atrinae]
MLSLVCGKKNPTQRELSYHLVLDPSQIVLIVDALEKMGLVQRQTDPNDRRSKIIVPTTEGQKLYKKAKIAVETSSDRTLSNLSDEERANLLGMLRKISLD